MGGGFCVFCRGGGVGWVGRLGGKDLRIWWYNDQRGCEEFSSCRCTTGPSLEKKPASMHPQILVGVAKGFSLALFSTDLDAFNLPQVRNDSTQSISMFIPGAS